MVSKIKAIASHKYFPILVLLFINLLVGALVVTDYGESWDEFLRYRYARKSIARYSGTLSPLNDDKGPAFVMLAALGGDLITEVYSGWLEVDAHHFITFLTFLLALFSLYRLCLRFTGRWAAFGAVLLFNTQPLLWGHAFINPKDFPFMVFFLASIDAGFEMVEGYLARWQQADRNSAPKGNQVPVRDTIKREWHALPENRRRLVIAVSVVAIVLLVAFVASIWFAQNVIQDLVHTAYSAQPTEFLGRIFSFLAENPGEVPAELYAQKALALYPRLVTIISLAVLIGVILLIIVNFPRTRSLVWSKSLRPYLGQMLSALLNKNVLLAALFLGLASAVRVLGPASGFLIAGYFVLIAGRRTLPVIATYLAAGALIAYLLWPGLWGNPFGMFFSSVSTASDLEWEGRILFAGIDYPTGDLPRSYLPVLLTIQFTLTALGCIIGGVIVAAVQTIKHGLDWRKIAVIALWFTVPITIAVIVQPTYYDNFRHFLFTIPPLFVFAAIGLQWLFAMVRKPAVRAGILLLLLLPNLYWMVTLHPYQYVYYNQVVGGVRGAFREYEMDYWATSYKEATEYINENAPAGANVIVWGAIHPVETYARPDLALEKYRQGMPVDASNPTYIIILTRHEKDLHLFPEAESTFTVGRDEAIYTVVRELQP